MVRKARTRTKPTKAKKPAKTGDIFDRTSNVLEPVANTGGTLLKREMSATDAKLLEASELVAKLSEMQEEWIANFGDPKSPATQARIKRAIDQMQADMRANSNTWQHSNVGYSTVGVSDIQPIAHGIAHVLNGDASETQPAMYQRFKGSPERDSSPTSPPSTAAPGDNQLAAPLESALRTLAHVSEALHIKVGKLEEQLAPLLRPNLGGCGSDGQKDAPPASSSVVSRIEGMTMTISIAIDRLEMLRGALEI